MMCFTNRCIHTLLGAVACAFLSAGEAAANDALVADFGSKITQAMCADGGAWLEAYHLPRERCPQISLSVLKPCMTTVLEGRAVPLQSEAELQQVSETLYACMKDSFLAEYGGSPR
ncbi:MAG: hypothetical protein RIS36_76 [Pseudomonadota bacterium]